MGRIKQLENYIWKNLKFIFNILDGMIIIGSVIRLKEHVSLHLKCRLEKYTLNNYLSEIQKLDEFL